MTSPATAQILQRISMLPPLPAAIGRLLRLVNDLLNYSRIEAGRLHYDIADVELGPLVRAVCAMIEIQAEGKNVGIEAVGTDDPVIARADGPKVEQIMLNLVVNAVKFTPAGGSVSLRWRREGDRAVVEVTDTGIGIPDDHLHSIFEPFVQVGRSLTTPHEGAGLGLAISRDLARAMGGDLSVRSTMGEGSTFTLVLPAAA